MTRPERLPSQQRIPGTYRSKLAGRLVPDAAGSAAQRRLVLHEEISTTPSAGGRVRDTRGGCPRWPEGLALLNRSTGEVVPGRCNSANMCDYCAKLNAVVNSECLALDAVESGNAPQLWLCLTTPRATLDQAAFYKPFALLMRAIRAEFAGAEYAALMEFTTGYGRKAGGQRRPHWNVLLKNVPPSKEARVRELVARHWCVPATGAKLRAWDAEKSEWHYLQHVGPIEDTGGLMRYVALHFQKESQSPPKGFRGHRFRKSRGYFDQPMPVVRARARRSLRIKRNLWRGLDAEQAEMCADAQALVEWGVRGVRAGALSRDTGAGAGEPTPTQPTPARVHETTPTQPTTAR